MRVTSFLPKALLFSVVLLAGRQGFSQVEKLTATKPISKEDAKKIQEILNKMDGKKLRLATTNPNGKTFYYGKPVSQVSAGRRVSSIGSYTNAAVIHTSITDFFFKPPSLGEKEQLGQLKTILSKYN